MYVTQNDTWMHINMICCMRDVYRQNEGHTHIRRHTFVVTRQRAKEHLGYNDRQILVWANARATTSIAISV